MPVGRIVGLIGPSGCGKSTMMRAIVGVQARVSGMIDVLGEPAGVASRRGSVGYVAQDPSVYDDLSIKENLVYFGRLIDVGSSQVDRVLTRVRLDDIQHQRVEDLSGGQRARTSLAIALLNEPPLLVLDEPTVGLDPVLRHELWAQFAAAAAAGSTLMVSSHVMDEANRCDRLIMLREGVVLAEGSPARPARAHWCEHDRRRLLVARRRPGATMTWRTTRATAARWFANYAVTIAHWRCCWASRASC